MARIIKTNFSGDKMTFEYATDAEAEALFNWHCRTSSECELWPVAGSWFTTYSRALGKCFDCWKN
jgi:hypothetical protein